MSNITLRQKAIIRKLCEEKDFTTMSQIANELEISSKTVERELYSIESWLNKQAVELQKKTRYGIKIVASDKTRRELLEKMNEEDGIMLFSQEDRPILSLVRLLKQKEPIKLYTLAKTLNVTESTISNDLDKLDTYLEKYNLLLVRKPGLGVYIEGKEKDIRRASIDLIYQNVGFENLLTFRSNYDTDDTLLITDAVKKRVLNLINVEQLQVIDTMIKDIEKDLNINFIEASYIGIIVHILLLIERVKLNEHIEVSKELEEEVKNYAEFALANKIKDRLHQHLNIKLPKNEVLYITIHLRGLKKYNQSAYNGNLTMENLKIIRLAKDIIKIAERETGMFLDGDGQLLIGLIHHLTPAINRMSMNLDIRNPIVEEIKQHYPRIFDIALQSTRLIEERFGLKVPLSEVGYIAMHLGGAIVKINNAHQHIYQVVISCALGIGSSGLLKSRIEKEFPNIRVSEIISIEKVENDYLKDSKADFVISTIETSNRYKPTICVNPLLFKEDKIRIEQVLADIKRTNIHTSVSKKASFNIEEITYNLKESIEGIVHILNNFYIHQYDQLVTFENVIKDISKNLGRKEEEIESIENSLVEREKYGSTVLGQKHAMLLHCRTQGVDEVHFQVVRLPQELEIKNTNRNNEEVDLIIVMVVPEKCNKNHLDILRYISQSMIEKEDFIDILRNKDFQELKKDLNIMLLDYYKGKL